MAPSTDTCVKCSKPFYGKQTITKCGGGCKLRAHSKCVNDVAFICTNCKAGSPSTISNSACEGSTPSSQIEVVTINDVHEAINNILLADSITREPDSIPDRILLKLESAESVVVSLRDEVHTLKSRVAILEKEKADLSVALQSTLSSYLPPRLHSSPAEPSYRDIARQGRLQDNIHAAPWIPGKFPVVGQHKDKNLQAQNMARQRNQKPVKAGQSSTSKLKAVGRPPHVPKTIRRGLFVSRMEFDLSSESLRSILIEEVGITAPICIRLKTKNPDADHSSFYVSCEDPAESDAINDPSVWPIDSIITDFNGVPRDIHKHPSELGASSSAGIDSSSGVAE